jgi:cell wall-associated NlpC family hydrolase
MADEYATKYATVSNTPTLRVREKQSTDSTTLELIPEGETYIVLKEYDDWAEILLGSDDAGNDFTGFVSKDYVTIEIDFKEAISIEEEQRQIKLQQEAERAEEERRQKQAEADARKKAEEEAEKKAAQAAKDNDDNDSKPSTQSSGSLSGLRSDIISYARKFVGGPYLWGGTSLTGGADCSGFVWRIYRDFGYYIPRTSYDQSRGAGTRVDLSDRQPGDLIFYANNNGTVNHVAMYIGNDQIVQAANSRQGIIISKYNYRKVVAIRRVVY